MRTLLGILAIIIGMYGYSRYIRDMLANKTKPHAFSWFVWSILTGIAFFAQLAGKAGPGAWVSGVTAVICLAIAIFAWQQARQNIVAIDWWFLAGALLSITVWTQTSNPQWSVILITLIDLLAFIPTFRKSYHQPHEETSIQYTLAGLKFVLALGALTTVSITTTLYPLSLVISNWVFVLMLYWRRSIVKAK